MSVILRQVQKLCLPPDNSIRLGTSVQECVGTMLFVLCGCASTLLWDRENPPSVEFISLSFGLTYAMLVAVAFRFSGGHFNPSVTFAMFVSGKISVIRTVTFFISQFAGAFIGSGILFCITPADTRGLLGTPHLHSAVSVPAGLGVEVVATFLLVYMTLVCVSTTPEVNYRAAAFLMGTTMTVCHMFGFQITGCGINPARAIGPAVVMSEWDHHWIYWAGPMIGALVAAGAHHSSDWLMGPPSDLTFDMMRGKTLRESIYKPPGTLLSEHPHYPLPLQEEIQTYL